MSLVDVVIRRIPGLVWLRLSLTLSGRCEPGHGWLYGRSIRRDTFTVARRGLVVMAMPRRRIHRATCSESPEGDPGMGSPSAMPP